MSIIIFVGPSLPVEEARSLLDADYRPPAKAGDVYAAALRRPQAIGIIDGFFESVPAVWHKEILHALKQGIPVYGASSMGALRAAELHAFGMQGVGRIFESYAAGELEDDDEVALIHAPGIVDFQPMSDPMVNIREGLRRVLELGLVSQSTHDLLLGIAKTQFYPDRSWQTLGRLGIQAGVSEEEMEHLLDFVRREKPDQKREDARELLRRIAEDRDRGFKPFEPGFRLERSIFFQRLAETTEQNASTEWKLAPELHVPRDEIVRHAMLTLDDHVEILRNALLSALAIAVANQLGVQIARQQIQERAHIFRRERHLLSAEETSAWLAANRISLEAFEEIMKKDAIIARLLADRVHSLDGHVIAELQRRGHLVRIVEAVRKKRQTLRELGITHPTTKDTGMDTAAIIEWHGKRFTPIHGSLDERAAELGFADAFQLLSDMAALYLWDRSAEEGNRSSETEAGADR